MKEKKYSEFTALKKLLRKKNYSYRRLAVESGMSINAINNKLNGYTALNIDEAKRICVVLKIGPSEFDRYFVS